MSVAFDNSNTGVVNSGGTSVSFSITIGAGSNMAILIACCFGSNSITGITCTVGGVAANLISGTDSGSSILTTRSMMFGLANPPAGAQTVVVSWTSATSAVIGAVSASGVDQITPINNGTFTFSVGGSDASITITSNAGDLTMDTVSYTSSTVLPSGATQLQEWSKHPGAGIGPGSGGSIGPGTVGPIIHGWSNLTANWTQSGANFNQSVSGDISAMTSRYNIQ